jgi:acyl carrier protein
MERQDVTQIVKKHTEDILEGIMEGDFAEGKTLEDLGADSLAMIEIVSGCMREMRVKISRSELKTIKNIEGLVDKLHTIHSETHGQG